MKKEMKIVLPFYKIAYAVSFVVILSVIRAVVFTYEIGLSIEPPFAPYLPYGDEPRPSVGKHALSGTLRGCPPHR